MSQFRCAVGSIERAESQVGTASTVRGFVVVQCPVRWGRDILRDAPLPERVRGRLVQASRAGAKVLLIRRHGRATTPPRAQVFAAYADPREPWLETATFEQIDDVADLDLGRVAGGESVGLERTTERLVCVCTHGRHDVCCAELGRPIAKALEQSHPDVTWEVSHIGGDRFAGNLLLLPHGLYYGRVTPEVAPDVVAAYLEGRLDLDHLRGRSSHPTAVQAAELFLRRHLEERDLDAVVVRRRTRDDTRWMVEMSRDSQTWEVVVAATRQDAAQLTCRATRNNAAPAYELVGITRRA